MQEVKLQRKISRIMKIESLGQIKEIEQIQMPGLTSPKFSEGEILIARVMQIEGGRVFLNSKNGAAFMALMQSDLGIAEGDMVEVIANGNGKGYTLNMLDLKHGQSTTADKAQLPVLGTVSGTLAMIKANPGLNPKAASFLVENNITGSPENAAALSNIVHGTGIASLLADIFSGLSEGIAYKEDSTPSALGIKEEAAEETGAIKTTVSENKVTENNTEKSAYIPEGSKTSATVKGASGQNSIPSSANNEESITQKQFGSGEVKSDNSAAAAQQSSKTQYTGPLQYGAAIPADEYTDASAPLQDGASGDLPAQAASGTVTAKGQLVPKENGFVPQGDKALTQTSEEGEINGASQQKVNNIEEIRQAIRDIFCKPDDQSGPEFKRAVSDIPDKLDRLKLLLQNSDNKDKEAFTQKSQEAQKLLEVMSGAKKFDYIQIPFLLKDGYTRTAEMYVHRRTRNQSETDSAGITILLALDTETIGRVETIIKTAGNRISLEFRLEHRELQQVIKSRAKSLAQKIEDAGYKLKEIRLTGLEVKTTVLNAGGLLQAAGAKTETVDVQI